MMIPFSEIHRFEQYPGLQAHHIFMESEFPQIADLPEKQRVVFLLSRIDKKTYKEIAEIVGISKQAVEKRMYNALDTLREVVSQRIR